MKYLVLLVTRLVGTTCLMTSSMIASRSVLYFTDSVCCVESTTVSMAIGWLLAS
jgi:hypothetical protein